MIAPEGLSVPALLDLAAADDHEALAFPTGRWTVTGLIDLSRSYARAFVACGIGPGDHVGAILPNDIPVVAMILGAASIGAVAVPINNRLRAREIAYIVDHSDMRLLLAGADHVEQLVEAFPGLAGTDGSRVRVPAAASLRRVVAVGGSESGLTDWETVVAAADTSELDASVAALTAQVGPEDEFIILYTSGTTSNPRGCVHTHTSIVRQGASLATRVGLVPGDRFWTPLTFFHVGGFDVLFASLAAGGTMVHCGRFEAGSALAQLESERVTVAFPAFETIWMPVLNHPDFAGTDLSRLRTVINVGTPERMRAMQDRLPGATQISCTGSTEGAGFICVGHAEDPAEVRAIWAGRPVDGMEAKIIDPETGVDLPDLTPGEFVFRGVSRFLRYYRDPRTTADRIDADGWYRSGDLLERDPDGRFRFHSRLGDMLKIGGENVAAAEIEDTVAALPEAALVQVVAAPDAHYGEVAAAFVQLSPGGVLEEAAVIAYCLDRMATFKVPRYVRFVDDWPMSGTKIQKAKLRERIAAELAAASITEAPRLRRRTSV
ncbi:AMP-binding protein [Nakamurella sp. YIM 132087]|uniref:AMP-binding protein n=1 Tax=Nakamurella alba TaxID=2665158 RepID=A0A7K1FJ14_9ACTN|nr:AMP-binding protein [Nakamurella alba]MTD13439.1 AMP-binding protein [Nakamurella alba]